MATKSRAVFSQPTSANSPLNDVDGETSIPPSPTRTSTANNTTSRRHTKGLSLNFPILLPTSAQASHLSLSPVAGSAVQSPVDSGRSSPSARSATFKIPDTVAEGQDRVNTRGSADFLTLLAAQERKVLELKEELQKAEADLLGLKKQWASYEAHKKRDEVKHVKKLHAVALDDVTSKESTEDEVDEERRRKRALVERSHTINTTNGNNSSNNMGRRGSKRVFEGGHTRTLSLLSPTSTKPGQLATRRTMNELPHPQGDAVEPSPDSNDDRPSLSRMPTLDGLISGEPLQLGFGKTYKDLALHRRSMPPVAADMFVKQGKQVYDGVREGLWTFFEDIRQATVGEEGIHGPATQQRPPRPDRKKGSGKLSNGQRKTRSPESLDQASKEPSFWREFGLDTPHRRAGSNEPATDTNKANGHVQQKSSTDSSNPPSLLPDLNDNDEADDGWDAWDSPASHRNVNKTTAKSGESLPWPEIQKLTPSKLRRTVSDLMNEWDASQTEGNHSDIPRGISNGQSNLLDSPHI